MGEGEDKGEREEGKGLHGDEVGRCTVLKEVGDIGSCGSGQRMVS